MTETERADLTKRASSSARQGDIAEIAKAYDVLMADAPGARRVAKAAALRESIAANMDDHAKAAARDSETHLDAYVRLLDGDADIGKLYDLYDRAGRLLD